MIGIRRERAVQRNDITAAVQFLQGYILRAPLPHRIIGNRIEGENLHPETGNHIDENPPDPPGSYHPRRFPVNIEAQKTVQGEVPLAHPIVGPVVPAVQTENQTRGVLGHRVGRVGRYPAHPHPPFLHRRQVNIIEARASQGDGPHPQIRQTMNHLGVHHIIHEHADRIETFGQGRCFLVKIALEELHLDGRGNLP